MKKLFLSFLFLTASLFAEDNIFIPVVSINSIQISTQELPTIQIPLITFSQPKIKEVQLLKINLPESYFLLKDNLFIIERVYNLYSNVSTEHGTMLYPRFLLIRDFIDTKQFLKAYELLLEYKYIQNTFR